MSCKTCVTFYRRPSGTVCFRRVSPRGDNDETVIRVQCTLIVTLLLKLSGQWVKYVFGCVYIDLPIREMKKKAKMFEFIHNLARGHMATACFLPSVVRHGRGKLLKRKVTPNSNVDLCMYRT